MSRNSLAKRAATVVLSFVLFTATAPFGVFAEEKAAAIQIVHTNDLHGYYTATERGAIGFAALKTLIDAKGADLVLDIGDTFHGQAFATVEQGMSMAELMKSVGYDAMTPGNHDWSYGADRLKTLEDAGGFSILASNVVTDSGKAFFDKPYLVKSVTADDGTVLKVGVVGVIDDAFYSSTVSDNVAGLKFEEEAQQVVETAKILREKEKCDIVLTITHQKDCKGFVSAIKGVDAVLAGHEHILIDESYPDMEGKQVPVVEAGCYFNNVGVLELTYDSKGKMVTKADETVYTLKQTSTLPENEAIKAQIASIEEREQNVLNEVIGETEKDFPYSWEEIRVSEQEIGKLITEAYINATGADIAFENAGGIRAGISSGDITYKDIISISPYGNVLVTKELTGKQILDILNHSLMLAKSCDAVYTLQKQAQEKGEDPYQYSWPDNSGSVLQFGGIEIETDESECITAAAIEGVPVVENKVYTVATNNYMADDSEYSAMTAAPIQKEYGTCEEALKTYVSSNYSLAAAKSPKEPLTRGEVVQMLLNTADDYNPGLQKSDVIKGYEDGELHEDWFVTRAEALVMLKRAFGALPKPVEHNAGVAIPAEQFTDIPDWARAELDDVFEAGIVAGTAEGIFSPDENVTAEQMKLFISRVFALFATNEKDDF